MSDQEPEKKTGDEGFVAPETGGQQPISGAEMENTAEVEITITLDENEREILAGAFSTFTTEYQVAIKEANPEDRLGKIVIKNAEEMIVKLDKLREKFNKLAPLLPYDIPDSE